MTIIESIFLNWIPLFGIIYLFLWYFNLAAPINRFVLSYVTEKGRVDKARRRIKAMTAHERVVHFAQKFLDENIVEFLGNPFADPERLERLSVLYRDDQNEPISDDQWGELLVSVLIDDDQFIEWMDWKYNPLTLLLENEEDNLLSKLFVKRGLPPVTDLERQSVLIGYPNIVDIEEYQSPLFDIVEVQPIADNRDQILLRMFNKSDQSLLMTMAKRDAAVWEETSFGYVEILKE